jgi:hypothetical protein
MLSEALQWIRDLTEEAATPAIEEIDGGIYLGKRDGTLERIADAQAPDIDHKFGDLQALADYLARFKSVANDSVILVGPTGVRAELAERDPRRRDRASVPLFTDDLPPAGRMDFEELLLFLDRHEGQVEQGAELRAAIQTIRVVQREEMELSDQGASLEIRTKGSRGVEGASATIPKWVQINLRFGDPEHRDLLRFRFKINVERGGGASFELLRFEQDGSTERWITSAIERLRGKLEVPAQWSVLRAAK